ncbi:MAG: DUF4091 domain-containing protein [Spirochaetaceae bacterium]
MENRLEFRIISSLEKVLPKDKLDCLSISEATVLKGEVFSFQIAYRDTSGLKNYNIKVIDQPELSNNIKIRTVGLVPSEFPCYSDHDDNIISSSSGLYPDVLYPLNDGDFLRTYPNQWRSIWITVDIPKNINSGVKEIIFKIEDEDHKIEENLTFNLNILNNLLPKQKLINTQWFHGDCVATYYKDEIFSENHWNRLNEQFLNCTSHGMNMLLTPIFTPPLDTKIGGERPTIQLINVVKTGGNYKFDFTKLNRWIDMALNAGFEFIEVSHLATQWGAEFCPKIIATEDGIDIQIFGWETKSLSPEYINFLGQLLPELDKFFIDKGIKKNVYFHVSDEPSLEHLEQFQKISSVFRKYLKDYNFIDALSDFDFYKTGAIPTPIPAIDHIEPFLEEGLDNLWAYYCCVQYKDVSNRFFNMPSARNRIIGLLLYKFKIKGFLHWGYNFYFTQFSIKEINPFLETDAGGGFPSGDSYMVYPGEDGPLDSIRHEVFYEGLQDLRALELLESIKGRDFVMNLLEGDLKDKLTFKVYPRSAEWLLDKRSQINNYL